jgi:hypothetical protein
MGQQLLPRELAQQELLWPVPSLSESLLLPLVVAQC